MDEDLDVDADVESVTITSLATSGLVSWTEIMCPKEAMKEQQDTYSSTKRVTHCDEEVIVFVFVFVVVFVYWCWFEVYLFVDNVGNCGWLVIGWVALRVPLFRICRVMGAMQHAGDGGPGSFAQMDQYHFF